MGRRRKTSTYAHGKTQGSSVITRKWTLRTWERLLCAVPAIALLLLSSVGLKEAISERPQLSTISLAVPLGFIVVGAGLLAFAMRSSMALTADYLMVRNVLKWRRIPLAQITSVEPGYYGMTILYTPGKIWVCLAFYKSNPARWLNRRVRSDFIAEEIMAAAREARTSE